MQFVIVTPSDLWTNWESANLRGSPASHVVISNNPTKTACGKNPNDWLIENEFNATLVSCKKCRKVLAKLGV